MYLNKRSNWFEVMDVVEGGPADRARIRLADRIVSIDGRKASGWTLPDVRLKLRGPVNTRINMTVERAKSTHQVVVVLKDLV
jgi:carboxyl-terminal processing protease